MSVQLTPFAAREFIGLKVIGMVPMPIQGYGIVFDNGRVLDLRLLRLLDGVESARLLSSLRRQHEGYAVEWDTLRALERPAEKPEPEPESYDLEVPEFMVAVPITDADPQERDEARQKRTNKVIDAYKNEDFEWQEGDQ